MTDSIPFSFQTTNDIRSAEKKIYDIVSDHDYFDKLENYSENELDNIIYRAEKIALSCRNAMEKKEKQNYEKHKTEEKADSKNAMTRVSFDGKILKIETPFTFKRFYRDSSSKENYILMNYIKIALADWQKQNHLDLFRAISAPLVVIMIRKGPKYDRTKICDNDNLENGRIINEIFDALGYSDNALRMDLYSCFRIEEDAERFGMEFQICSRNDFPTVFARNLL